MHLWNGIIPLPSLALSMSSPGLPGPQEGLGLLLVALLPLALLLRRVHALSHHLTDLPVWPPAGRGTR